MQAATTDRAEREERQGEEFRLIARQGLSKEEIRELSKVEALPSTLAVLKTWTLIAAALAAGILSSSPWIIAAAILCVGAGQHGLAVLAHEAAHYRLYKSRRLNDVVGRLCAGPLGLSMISYRLIHRIHHNHLYEPIDPDLALMAGYPRGAAYLLRKLAKDLTGLTTFKNYMYFFQTRARPNAEGSRDDTSVELRKAARRDQITVISGNLALFGGLFAAGYGGAYLVLWLLPLATLLQAMLRLRAVMEHGAVTDMSSPLRAARTNFTPWYLSWALFPHQVHYHVEHHLYPSIPHFRLPECHRRLVARGALEQAEISTLSETMRKIFAAPRAASSISDQWTSDQRTSDQRTSSLPIATSPAATTSDPLRSRIPPRNRAPG